MLIKLQNTLTQNTNVCSLQQVLSGFRTDRGFNILEKAHYGLVFLFFPRQPILITGPWQNDVTWHGCSSRSDGDISKLISWPHNYICSRECISIFYHSNTKIQMGCFVHFNDRVDCSQQFCFISKICSGEITTLLKVQGLTENCGRWCPCVETNIYKCCLA